MFESWKAKRLLSGLTEEASADLVEQFRNLGDSGVDALIVGLRHESVSVRAGAARVLGELGPPRAIQPLAACARELPRAAAALTAIASRTTRPRVLRAIRGGNHGTAALVALLTAGDEEMRREAEAALVHAGPPAALALAAAFETDEVSDAAGRVLARMGPDGIAGLVSLLQHKRKEVRRRAASALEASGWRPAGPAEEGRLAAALQDWERCRELGAAAVEPLTGLLTDSDSDVRQSAARVLGALKDPRAVPALIAALDDRKDGVRLAAVEALGEIGDRGALAALGARLRSSGDLRAPALKALQKIGWQPEAMPDRILLAVLSEDRRTLADPEARRWLVEAACEQDYSSLPEAVVVRGLGLLEEAEPELLRILKRGGQPAAVAREILNDGRAAEEQYVICPECLTFAGVRGELREAGGRLRCAGCGARILL